MSVQGGVNGPETRPVPPVKEVQRPKTGRGGSKIDLLWVIKMAWRDSRSHRKRLLLFTSSIVVGTGALVATTNLEANLEQAADEQARTLLGADLALVGRRPFAAEVEALIDSIGGAQSRQIDFSSMVHFPKNGGTRLARVRALEGAFPYYGEFETVPRRAATTFRSGQNALVDESMMLQFGAEVGDSVKVGGLKFRIAGNLKKIPGEVGAIGLVAPRVYIPLHFLPRTGLVQRGSQVAYRVFFRLDRSVDAGQLAREIQPQLNKYHLSSETAAQRRDRTGRTLANLYYFLNLAGFIALVLGSMGIASSIHTYVKQKLTTVAILRCLGAGAGQSMAVYLVQAAAMGLLGAGCGSLIGIGLLFLLPDVLGDFLPLDIGLKPSGWSIIQGIAIGLGMAVLFALLPLLALRRVSPLRALRSSYEESTPSSKDPLRWLVYLALGAGVILLALLQTRSWVHGLSFAASIAVSFSLLALLGRAIACGTKKFLPASWSYVWRQGLANLHRPNNQTVMLIVVLGLGTFLISTFYLARTSLLERISFVSREDQPNMVLFDIQPDQRKPVSDLLDDLGLPLMQQVPIVTMRLEEVKGRRVEEIRNDSTSTVSRWALRWEYRSTYRDRLVDTETLVGGEWRGRVARAADTVFVSLEEGVAGDLQVGVGDDLVFDVQGLPIPVVVGSLRRVEWQRISPNFLVLFPAGVLEEAPQFYVLVTRSNSEVEAAALQQEVVKLFPNVSIIDLKLILDTTTAILDRASRIIRFMASFSLATGLIVLVAVIVNSRYQRLQESVLLQTLGASRSQIRRIMLVEYLLLGGFSATAGLILALIGNWALSYYVFEAPFAPAPLPLLILLAVVMGSTALVGTLTSSKIFDRPPLEVLRAEA